MDDDGLAELGANLVIGQEERPTLKTIARLAGLAVPTVSRALSDAPDIGEETKRRVRDIASRLGYTPNRTGLRLRTGKTNVISLVLSTEAEMMNVTARLITSLVAGLRGTSYHLIVTPYFPDEDPVVPIRYIVETGSADGIIFNQTQPRDPRAAWLLQRGFPFATHGRTDFDHAWADFDNGEFGRLAVEEMVKRGRRKVAVLLPPDEHNYSRHMRAGTQEAAGRLGVEAVFVEGATSDSPADRIAEAATSYLVGPGRCDGFILASAVPTLAVVTAAERAGRVLGRDLDVASKEAIPFLRQFRPEILTILEDVTSVGTFLAKAVLNRIERPAEPPMQHLDVPVADWDRH
jgi:LacI family transcriptional regulator